MPDGVFVRVPVGEHKRERLMGAVATVFSATRSGDGIPPALRRFVVPSGTNDDAAQGSNSDRNSDQL
jgi:hypothetical protein